MRRHQRVCAATIIADADVLLPARARPGDRHRSIWSSWAGIGLMVAESLSSCVIYRMLWINIFLFTDDVCQHAGDQEFWSYRSGRACARIACFQASHVRCIAGPIRCRLKRVDGLGPFVNAQDISFPARRTRQRRQCDVRPSGHVGYHS